MKKYLGTNYGHGAASALLDSSGELLFAVEEERLTDIKDTSAFPTSSLNLIRQNFNGDFLWAEGWRTLDRLVHKGFKSTFVNCLKNPFYFKHRLVKEVNRYATGVVNYRLYKEILGCAKVNHVGHHLAHAYSLLPWGLPNKSLVLVSDTTAEEESISIFFWFNNQMIFLTSSIFPNSIGSLFHQLAYHVGFEGRTGPGKLMAYSSYGQPIWKEEFSKLVAVNRGRLEINSDLYPSARINDTWLYFAKNYCTNRFLKASMLKAYKSFESGRDLASSMQELFTATTFEIIKQGIHLVSHTIRVKVEHLGLAGGAALNCQANGFFLRNIDQLQCDSLIVSPWSDDSGTAIGAAVWLAKRDNKNLAIPKSSPYLGPLASSTGILVTDNDVFMAVEVLRKGGIIALVSGRLEFGARALGNRCILASARSVEIKDRLNNAKSRYKFMPFAPVVLQEDYNKLFFGRGSSNMAWTVRCTSFAQKYVSAACHISNEARVQVVDEGLDGSVLRKVLEVYKRKTGLGVLLLTSLNASGQPIAVDMTRGRRIAQQLVLDGLLSDEGWIDGLALQKI